MQRTDLLSVHAERERGLRPAWVGRVPITAVLSPSGFTGAGTPAETVNTMSEGPSQGIASMIPMADSALPINTFRECYNGGWCPSMCSRWRS